MMVSSAILGDSRPLIYLLLGSKVDVLDCIPKTPKQIAHNPHNPMKNRVHTR